MLRAYVYVVVILLGLIGLSGSLTMIGFFLLLLPGVVLLAAPTLALYLPFADGMLMAARGKRWLLTLCALCAWIVIFTLLPLSTNQRLQRAAEVWTSRDFGAPIEAPMGRLFLVSDSLSAFGGCSTLCSRLLLEGQASAVIVPLQPGTEGWLDASGGFPGEATVFGVMRQTSCEPLDWTQLQVERSVAEASDKTACIVRRLETTPVFDTALVSKSLERSKDYRFNPLDPGISRVERRTIWRCDVGACRQTLMKTSVHTRPLAVPIVIGARFYGHTLERELARGDFIHNRSSDAEVLSLASGQARQR